MDAAVAAVACAAGVQVGKRQVGDLARRAAADVEAFYTQRAVKGAPDGAALVLTFDGKGVVMCSESLRPATAKAARSAENKLVTRLSAGETPGG
jgi:hypothetical protein